MTLNATAYLCHKRLKAAEFIKGDDSAVSVSGNDVTVKLMSVAGGCDPMADRVVVKLEAVNILGGRTVYTCRSHGGDYLSIEYPSVSGGRVVEHPLFTVKNAEHCHWFLTQTFATGPDRCGTGGCLFVETIPTAAPGAIPADKSDVFPELGESITHEMSDNAITPGMLVSVKHYYFNGDDAAADVADAKYYTSATFTGGIVTAVNSDTYEVDLEGTVVTCRPSDWVQYEVGDWVIVLKSVSVIVPMKLGLDGA